MISEELEKSLRSEVDDYINSRVRGLQDELEQLQSQINEAFTRLQERSASAAQADNSVAFSISEYIRAAHERGIQEAASQSSRARSSSDMAILKAAIEDLDDQRSQAEILNTLVNRAASFAPRVAFFVVKNEQATGWRARGLEGTIGDEAIRQISFPLSTDTPISDVVNSRSTWSGSPGANAEDHLLLQKLGGEPPQRMVAIPLTVRNKAVAVLYADSAGLDSDAINLEALESLVRVSGMAVELLSTTRPAPAARPARVEEKTAPEAEAVSSAPAEAEDSSEAETYAPAAQTEATAEAEEEAAAAPQAEEEPAPQPSSAWEFSAQPQPSTSSAPAVEPAVEEAPQPQAPFEQTPAPTEPAMTPAAAAPAMSGADMSAQPQTAPTGQFAAPLGARRYGAADVDLPIEVAEDERRLHNDARRFARLLVSEIKLYNEQKVKEGRSQGNLYERLREDIDRSRQMYDKRVAPPVAARYDYFHQELVNTLAEGDPNKLGEGYPGSSIPA
ncbi:MAG TPA: hypothetical protein VJS44_10275 [Pyrinomonadaceae bacterium]|nr:hypothetical protein [Pyrinomonadaceae bacterium]